MDLKNLKAPSVAQSVGSFAIVAMLWSGSQIAAVPERLQQLETASTVLAHRVEQLEKVVTRENQTVAKGR